jgi:hypothetical protein
MPLSFTTTKVGTPQLFITIVSIYVSPEPVSSNLRKSFVALLRMQIFPLTSTQIILSFQSKAYQDIGYDTSRLANRDISTETEHFIIS